MEFKPHEYQKTAIQWALNHPKCGLFLDMGLGKTVVTYTVLSELIFERFDVVKALVIAPKRVAEDTWPTECEKWDHLKNIKISKVLGTPKQRLKALEQEADVYIITRDNLIWLTDQYTKKKKWPFDTLIIDELSSFKSYASKRFKKLKIMTPYFKRVIGLTGTPAPNGYEDLWSQIYLLDRGERLGKNITAYRRKYFNAINFGNFVKYNIKPEAQAQIDTALADICISMKAKDYLKELKEPVIVDVKAKMNLAESTKYTEMAKNAITQIDESEIVALSAATVTNKLLQMANGAVYDEDKKINVLHDRKLEALEDLINEAQGENVLVFYNFKSDLARIQEKFQEAKKLETEKEIKAWNAGEIKMLLAHPASCGHGLNLQDGGSIIIWFGLNWSLELYQQANARLQRQGQKNTVRIYRILTEGTIDAEVIQALNGKYVTQENLLNKLKQQYLGGKNA